MTDLALTDLVIDGSNGSTGAAGLGEGALTFVASNGVGLSGTATIADSHISGGRRHNLLVINTSGSLMLYATNTTFRDNGSADGDHGVSLAAIGTALLNTSFSGDRFDNHRGNHLDVEVGGSSTDGSLIFTGNSLSGTHASGLQGVAVRSLNHQGSFFYDVSNNGTLAAPWTGTHGDGNCAINVLKGTGSGNLSGWIEHNVIGGSAVGSGSANGCGILVSARSTDGTHTTRIHNNRLRQYFSAGIRTEVGDGATTLNATVINNDLDGFSSPTVRAEGIQSANGLTVTDGDIQACLDIRNNALANAGNEAQGGMDLSVGKTASTSTVLLPGYSGGSVQTYLQSLNPSATSVQGSGSNFTASPAPECPLP